MPVTSELLQRLALASEENNARQVLESCVIARLYPSGKVPPLSVTFCRDWLRDKRDEDSFEFHLLNMVEIHDDDQSWSINGEPQGGLGSLIKFIVGDLPHEEMGWILTELRVDYNEVVGLAKDAANRRAALGIS